jgi:transcriptional regulator with XRE-family HTH domain
MNAIENIQRVRSEKRISQAEMAEKLGIAQNNYGKIERGITELTIERLYKIAEVLGTPPVELLGFEIPKLEEKNESGESDNKKIENLEKRILELEDRLKDKERIITFNEDKLEKYTFYLEDFIRRYTHEKAKEYGLMTYAEKVYDSKRLPLKLKGKWEYVSPMFKDKVYEYEEYIDKHDLQDIIILATESDKELSRFVFHLATEIGSNSEIVQCWRDLIYNKSNSERRRPKINYEVVNVSE